MKQKKRVSVAGVLAYAAASLWGAVTLLPFYFMVQASFKTAKELTMAPLSFPDTWVLTNYEKVLSSSFPLYLRNSVLVLLIAECLLVLFAAMASYVFAKHASKVTAKLLALVIACMSIPTHIAFIPTFNMMRAAGVYNTIWALIPTYTAFQMPISVFMLTSFIQGIPDEIEEAARIDGASLMRVFFTIIFPLSMPGIVTIAIYDGIFIWNEYSFALILTSSSVSRTLPLAISDFKSEYTANTPAIMAVLSLSVLPMLLAFSIGQKRLVKGMMAGAVKG